MTKQVHIPISPTEKQVPQILKRYFFGVSLSTLSIYISTSANVTFYPCQGTYVAEIITL